VHRPAEVTERLIPGYWEGDLLKGAFNRSCVGTLVERTTRFVVLCKMDGCTAQDALEGFTRQMKKLPHRQARPRRPSRFRFISLPLSNY